MIKNRFQNKKKLNNICIGLFGNTTFISILLLVFYPKYCQHFNHLKPLKETSTEYDFVKAQFISVNSSYALIIMTLILFVLLVIISYKLIISLKYKKKLLDLFGAQTKSLEKSNLPTQLYHSNDHLYFGMFTHDIKGALSAMGRMSTELTVKINQGDFENTKTLVHELDNGIQFLNHHVKHYLIWLMSKNNLIVEDEKIDINEFLIEISQTAKAIYFKNNNNLSLSLSDSKVYIQTKPLLLKIILLNIIENAFKHTMNDSVVIKTVVFQNEIIISCTDAGIGMSQDDLTDLGGFNFYNNQKNTDSFGMGYKIVYDLIEVLKGKIEIDSKINVGTEVKVKLLVN